MPLLTDFFLHTQTHKTYKGMPVKPPCAVIKIGVFYDRAVKSWGAKIAVHPFTGEAGRVLAAKYITHYPNASNRSQIPSLVLRELRFMYANTVTAIKSVQNLPDVKENAVEELSDSDDDYIPEETDLFF